MARFLISFDDDAMRVPEDELPAVSEATHAVVRDAKAAGVWVFGGGIDYGCDTSVVSPAGDVTHGPDTRARRDRIGGMCIIDVPARGDALEWAARFAATCRCAQQVREFMYDPES
jgi:hypothetical protein